jgi:ATP-dependent helicase/nuclease subunit B
VREVICGPFHSGHRALWAESMREKVRAGEGQECLYLVPTRGLAGVVRQKIYEGLPGGVGEHVLTLFEVVEDILARSGRTYVRLEALTAERLVAKAMRHLDLEWNGEALAAWSHSPGVVAAFRRHIGELKRAMIGPERMTELAAEVQGTVHEETMCVMAAVYAAYQQELQAGDALRLDTEETYLEAARVLCERGLDGVFPGVRHVFVDSFTDFQPYQMNVVLPLLDAEEVRVYLPYQMRRWEWMESLADGMRETVEQLVRAGLKVVRYEGADLAKAGVEARVWEASDGAVGLVAAPVANAGEGAGAVDATASDAVADWTAWDLRALQERLFAPHPAVLEAAPNVKVFAARTVEKEWLWVAKRIKELHGQGVALSEMAILTHRELQFGQTAHRVLQREGVPVEAKVALTADAVPWVRDLLTLYTLDDADWHRDVLQQLAGAESLFGEHPLAGRETVVLEAGRRFGLVRGRWMWQSRLQRVLDGVDAAEPEGEDLLALSGFLSFLYEKVRDLPAEGRGQEHVQAMRGLLPDGAFYHRAVERFRAEGGYGYEHLQRDLQARESVERVLAALEETAPLLGEEETYTRTEFVQLLRRHLEGAEIVVEPGRRGGVAFMTPSAARGLSFRHVFFVGLNEGEWPMPPNAPWLLRESLREELAGRMPLLSPQVQVEQQKMFFLMGWHTATEGVWLSHVSASKQDLPSRFLDEVYGICPALADEAESDEYLGGSALYPDDMRAISNVQEARDWLAARMAGVLGGEGEWDSVLAAEALLLVEGTGLPFWQQVLSQAEGEWARAVSPAGNRYDGVLEDAQIREELAERFSVDQVYSVSQFNRYGECGYKYFLSRVLKLDAEQEEEKELSALEKGNLYHRVLQRLYRGLADEVKMSETAMAGLQASLESIFAEEWGKVQGRRVTEVGLRQELERERMLRRMRDWLKAETEAWRTQGIPLVPRYLEWVFGMNSGDSHDPQSQAEPVTVGGLKFRGQIDRIDVTENGEFFLVVDYKTKGTKTVPKAIVDGVDFQLPVYLRAVEQALFDGKATAVGAAYYSIEKADRTTSALVKAEFLEPMGMGRKRTKLDGEAWADLMERSEERLGEYRHRMTEGVFPVLPSDKALCEHCDYRHVCRFDKVRALSLGGAVGAVSGEGGENHG